MYTVDDQGSARRDDQREDNMQSCEYTTDTALWRQQENNK